MATKTIGSGKDYATIALWSTYVKALVTLTENEIGQLTDDANYTYGATADLDFSGVTLSGFTITLQATTNKHDGDFGNGSRVEANGSFGGIYKARSLFIEDMSFTNTQASAGGARVFLTSDSTTYRRVIAKTNSTGGNCDVFEGGTASAYYYEACRAVGGTKGFDLLHAGSTLNNCTAIGATIGIAATTANTATSKNNAVYNCGTDWSGTWSGTYSNNASEDVTHPGTSGVTISGDPFDADGYTPASSGQLDGAGVDLSISLDAANNSFNATPSIGAYESIGAAPSGRIMGSLANYGGLAGQGGIAGRSGGLAG